MARLPVNEHNHWLGGGLRPPSTTLFHKHKKHKKHDNKTTRLMMESRSTMKPYPKQPLKYPPQLPRVAFLRKVFLFYFTGSVLHYACSSAEKVNSVLASSWLSVVITKNIAAYSYVAHQRYDMSKMAQAAVTDKESQSKLVNEFIWGSWVTVVVNYTDRCSDRVQQQMHSQPVRSRSLNSVEKLEILNEVSTVPSFGA